MGRRACAPRSVRRQVDLKKEKGTRGWPWGIGNAFTVNAPLSLPQRLTVNVAVRAMS